LANLGQGFTLLDGGIQIEEDKRLSSESLRSKNFPDWEKSDFENYSKLNDSDSRLRSHPGSKLKFGSSFCYTSPAVFSDPNFEVVSHLGTFPSLATGGLSHVWGSIAFPFTHGDVAEMDTKISTKDYLDLERVLQISGRDDDLSKIYEIAGKLNAPVKHSNLTESLDKQKHKERGWFEKNLFTLGTPRVAVETTGPNACQACGLCATGCVWGSIWDSEKALEKLKSECNFVHSHGAVASRITQMGNSYEVELMDGTRLHSRRIFLACGAISTTILLMKSKLIPEEVYLEDTQLSILPGIALHGKQTDSNFVLSQYILHSAQPNGKTDAFIQITGFNQDLVRRVRGLSPISKIVPKFLLNYFFRFIAISMIFQNSESSGRLAFVRQGSQILIEGDTNGLIPYLNSRNSKKLSSALLKIRIVPLRFLSQIVEVGESYHLGNLQLRDRTPVLGRNGSVPNTRNLFVVDSCALEIVAPGPITYPAMANAARIVKAVIKK
jgi:ferredoxin